MKTLLFITLILSSNISLSQTICVAHRGNNAEFLENSMASISSAAELGAPGVEFDIQHTKDGVPIVMHDSTLKRTVYDDGKCPFWKKVKDMNYEDMSQCVLKNGEPIPTLDQTLEYLSGTSSDPYVELKSQPNHQTIAAMKKYYDNKPDHIKLISFKSDYLEWIHDQKTFYPFLENVDLIWVSRKSKSSIKSFLNGIDVKKLKKKHFKKYQEDGTIVGVWTKDSEKSIRYYMDLGVDFVTTNEVRRCLAL